MATPRTPPPPPVIGRAGSYTVFITPPTTPTPSEGSMSNTASPTSGLLSSGPRKESPLPAQAPPPSPPTPTPSEGPRSYIASPAPILGTRSPGKEAPLPVKAPPSWPPPVQVPPQQFEKPAAKSSGSAFGFLWDAVAKVQDAHSSLDEYLADWFGLNQSKYQWALNDYYESSGKPDKFEKFEMSLGENALATNDACHLSPYQAFFPNEKESGKVRKPKDLVNKGQAV